MLAKIHRHIGGRNLDFYGTERPLPWSSSTTDWGASLASGTSGRAEITPPGMCNDLYYLVGSTNILQSGITTLKSWD